jgi:hypothetical protein
MIVFHVDIQSKVLMCNKGYIFNAHTTKWNKKVTYTHSSALLKCVNSTVDSNLDCYWVLLPLLAVTSFSR